MEEDSLDNRNGSCLMLLTSAVLPPEGVCCNLCHASESLKPLLLVMCFGHTSRCNRKEKSAKEKPDGNRKRKLHDKSSFTF